MIRRLYILLIGLSLTGCGPRVPSITQQRVLRKDVVGTKWHFRGSAPSTSCEINFNADGSYSLVWLSPGSAVTNRGEWSLSSAGGRLLDLFPVDDFSPIIERHNLFRWWFTDL